MKGRKRKKGGVWAEEERKFEKQKEKEEERTPRGRVASFSHVQHCVCA